MSQLYDEFGHLTYLSLQAIKTGSFSEVKLLQATSHIANCEKCAAAYAESFNTDELLEIPCGFSEEIAGKLHFQKENIRQFYFYSLRVAIAVCAALVIIFSGALNYVSYADSKFAHLNPPELRFVDSINSSLQNFSQKLLDMEAFK